MLTFDQISELVKTRPQQKAIQKADYHHSRLKFHTDVVLDASSASPYYKTFLAWIGSNKPELLPAEKVERFKQLLTFPVPTVELTESVKTALGKVFDAQDRFYRYDFDKPEIADDWEEYRDETFWRTHGLEAMMSAINSVWVVDLPMEQGDKPEPKDMLIDISSVIDISIDADNNCNHLIFAMGEKLFVYDDEFIRVWEYVEGDIGALITEVPHRLGYTPARMFWTDKLSKDCTINKKSPLTTVLSDLDWLLVHITFKKYMDIANSYPIITAYEGDNDFVTGDGAGPQTEKNTLGGNLIGPGSIWTLPMPKAGEPTITDAMKMISPDVTTLTFHVGEETRLWDRIYKAVVGFDGEPKNDQAQNEKQVQSSFESRIAVMERVATNFEIIQAFADEVKIALRYGADALTGIAIDYGSKFFMKDAGDILDDINEAKTKGSHDVILDILMDELIEAKFRNDNKGKLKASVVMDLDPLPNKTIKEAEEILKAGGITDTDFKLKANLMGYVRRFEREQIPVVDFVSKDYNKGIGLIKEEFIKYINDENDSSKQRQVDPDQGE